MQGPGGKGQMKKEGTPSSYFLFGRRPCDRCLSCSTCPVGQGGNSVSSLSLHLMD